MNRYYKIDYRGQMPSIQGHRFHPWLFVGTEEEFNWCIDQLSGREDEFKIHGWNSYDTYEEYCREFPITSKIVRGWE